MNAVINRNAGIGRKGSRAMLAALAGLGFALALGTAHAQPGHDGPGGPPDAGRGPIGEMEMISPHMLRELNLTPDQEKKLKEARLAAQKKKIQLHSEKATLELDLKNVLSTYPVNKAEAMKLAEKVADVEKRMTLQRVETLVQLLGGLTAEQHAKLQVIQDEWAEKRRAWRDEMRKDRWDKRDGKGPKGDGD